jgi:hypothetical protein
MIGGKYVDVIRTVQGGGDFLEKKCDSSPLTPDDSVFTNMGQYDFAENIVTVDNKLKLNLQIPNLDKSSVNKGSSNRTVKTKCSVNPGEKTFLYRESIREFDASDDDSMNNYLHETYLQVVMANQTEQLSPHVYMFGRIQTNADRFRLFTVSELMIPYQVSDFAGMLYSNSNGPRYLDEMFNLIDRVGEKYTFIDNKYQNMVHDANYRAYMIDTDPNFLIQDGTIYAMIKILHKKGVDISGLKDIAHIRKGTMYYIFCHITIAWLTSTEVYNTSKPNTVLGKCIAKLEEYFSDGGGGMTSLIQELITLPYGHGAFKSTNDWYILNNRADLIKKNAGKFIIDTPSLAIRPSMSAKTVVQIIQQQKAALREVGCPENISYDEMIELTQHRNCLKCYSNVKSYGSGKVAAANYSIRQDCVPLYCDAHTKSNFYLTNKFVLSRAIVVEGTVVEQNDTA